MWHKVKFKQSFTGLNSEFSFSFTGGLFEFYGKSTFVIYLMPNPFLWK